MSEPTERKDDGSLLAGIGRHTTGVAAIVGVVVSLNTLVASCSRDSIQRHESFRAAVKQEEDYWSNLYGQYLQALELPAGDPRRDAKLFAVSELAKHSVPRFDEYSFGPFDKGEVREAAWRRLEGMQATLRHAITDARSSSPAVAKQAAYEFAQQDQQRQRDGNTVTPVAQAATRAEAKATPIGSGPSYATQVLAVGARTGWDVDVFWCTGGDETMKFGLAETAAGTLAAAASGGDALAAGIKLGRVRLRALPETQQARLGVGAASGNIVVSDGGRGEDDVAAAIGRRAAAATNAPFGQAKSSGKPTPYYVSALVCGSRQAPPPVTTPQVAAN